MNAVIAAYVLTPIRRTDGQDLLEYALLSALIAVVAVGAMSTVGTTIKTVLWEFIAGATGGI